MPLLSNSKVVNALNMADMGSGSLITFVGLMVTLEKYQKKKHKFKIYTIDWRTKYMNYWQGNKICLRAMEESDADFFYETLQDMDIQKNESDIRVPMSQKACADFAMEQASKGNDNTSPFLIIEDKDKNRVGMASPSIEDSRVGVFTTGIFIKPEFQRKGYAKEAIFMILKFYFYQLRCQKFNASVYSYNEPSNSLCQKMGLVVEGRRRNTVFTDGKFYDEILYGLTKDEFSELIKSH